MDGGLELTGTLPATSRISLPLLTGEVEQTTPDSRNKSDSSVADPDGRVGGWRVPRPWLRRARLTRGRGRGRCRRSRGEPRRPASVAVYALAAMAIRNPALVLACGVMGLPVRVTTSRHRRHPSPQTHSPDVVDADAGLPTAAVFRDAQTPGDMMLEDDWERGARSVVKE